VAIGNNFGMFLSLESGWEMKIDQRWDWLQIEVDLQDGSHDEIELVWGRLLVNQNSDYWRFPFRFFGFHAKDHLQAQCNRTTSHFPPFSKIWKRKQKVVSVDLDAAKEEGDLSLGGHKKSWLISPSKNPPNTSLDGKSGKDLSIILLV
jgi:hypothetical protein